MFKFTLILVGMCAVVGVVFLVRAWVNSSKGLPSKALGATSPAPIYADLRDLALTRTRADLGLGATQDWPGWGVLMETGYPEGTATLVSMSDGSASLYFSGGGGVIGGSGHESVRRAATEFVQIAGQQQAEMRVTTTFPLPRASRTVFYLLTDSGVFTAEADENALGENQHALSHLFYAGQEVITQLRLVSDLK